MPKVYDILYFKIFTLNKIFIMTENSGITNNFIPGPEIKNDTVGLFLRAMVDREPGKRKVKPSKAALIDLAELDLGESSDDSDFNVDEAKLKEDDDISINSDPDDDDDDDDDDDADEENIEKVEVTEESKLKEKSNMTVSELIAHAQEKQKQAKEMGVLRPKVLVCSICLGDYSDDMNEIVTCDGCHVCCHEGCYGISDTISVSSTVSSSSTEPWFCDACKAGVTNPPCELCPNLGHTIFKETEMGRWVHLVCALYIPGIAFSEVDKLSFPTLFEMSYSRYGAKTCSLCEDERYSKTGVCIGCDAGMCRSYFHVTCAQREGLLSEVNHYEADQADPYYAHCRLHTDRELIKRRKRNWLALQLHMKQGEMDRLSESQKVQDRLQRKLIKYREKYTFTKANKPAPWLPTQKMPRSITTCASLFRSLLHKTKLMGIETESLKADVHTGGGQVRKKWHIQPAFNVEFISYFLDRMSRLKEMKSRLDTLLKENDQLIHQELDIRDTYNLLDAKSRSLQEENSSLLNKALEMHDLLKTLAGRPLRLPPAIAALHDPQLTGLQSLPQGKDKRLIAQGIITKAAAKMISLPSSPAGSDPSSKCSLGTNGVVEDVLSLHTCSVCEQMRDQHLLIQCDTCIHYYHLSCLDPPLTRMPKKTKQMGWQCSDCCKSSDSDKACEIDTAAPRRLRRIVKEPSKFSPNKEQKFGSSQVQMGGQDTVTPSKVKVESPPSEGGPLLTSKSPRGRGVKSPRGSAVKRRLSADAKRGKAKIRRRSADVAPKKGPSPVALPSSLDMSAESLPSASSLNSPHSSSVGDDDPLSPRKEKRHSKKKKKDKDKEERKKKKHKDRHSLGEMASQLVSPFRIKIKPLPPRPNESEEAPSGAHLNAPHTTWTTTAPPGYPPLPPGYTLTQPMSVDEAALLNLPTSTSAPPESSSRISTTTTTSSASAASTNLSSSGHVVAPASRSAQRAGSGGRRKSDPAAEQFSKCDVCGETGGVTNTVMCDECLKAYHFNCLEPPLKKSPKRRGYSWFCEDCGDNSAPPQNADIKLT